MLRIGFDVTALHVAVGGVYSYDLNLVRSMVHSAPHHEFVLLDYSPIHGRRVELPELASLQAPNLTFVRCGGLRHRRLSRWQPLQRPGWSAAAQAVDWVLSPPWSHLAEAAMDWRLTRALPDLDIFHSSDVLQWRCRAARNVVTIYDLTALLMPDCHTSETRDLQRRKLRFAQEKADMVLAISEATKRDVIAELDIGPERVRVVPGGVAPAFQPIVQRDEIRHILEPLGLAQGAYLLYVGTLEPRKNLVRLIEAYDWLHREMPPPVPRLVLAGSAGWGCGNLFNLVRSLELEHEVVWLGHVDQRMLPVLYNGAAVFVYPSLYEGFGLPPLEAMACGTPVVVSDRGALLEVVGDAGVVVDPLDTAQIEVAIASLLSDSDRREALGQAGLVRAKQFTWARSAQAMLGVYEELGD